MGLMEPTNDLSGSALSLNPKRPNLEIWLKGVLDMGLMEPTNDLSGSASFIESQMAQFRNLAQPGPSQQGAVSSSSESGVLSSTQNGRLFYSVFSTANYNFSVSAQVLHLSSG